MKKKRIKEIKKAKLIYYILILILVIAGVSFAAFTVNFIGTKEHTVDLKGLIFRYTEDTTALTYKDPTFLTDSEGKSQTTYFDFTTYIENTYNYAITYNIYLKELANNNINKSYVKVYLEDQNGNVLLEPTKVSNLVKYPNDDDSYILRTDTITPNSTTNNKTNKYRLRIWVDKEYEDSDVIYTSSGNNQTGEIEDKIFAFKVNVDNLTFEKDTKVPVITSVTTDTNTSNTYKQIHIEATDNIGISGYLIKTSNDTPTLDDSWEYSNSTSYVTKNIFTNGTYYVWAKDTSNNISLSKQIVISGVDTVKPVCTITGPSVNNISKDQETYFVLTCTDDNSKDFNQSNVVEGDLIVSNAQVASIKQINKEKISNGYKYTITLVGRETNGDTTLKLKKDVIFDGTDNGNNATDVSSVLTVYNLKNLNGSVLINNGASYTKTTNVTLTINADGATKMCITQNSNKDIDCKSGSSSWENYATSKSYTLEAGDGLKTVYVYFDNDSYGQAKITLDTIKPTCTITEDDASWTKQKTLIVTAEDSGSGVSPSGYSFDNSTFDSVTVKTVIENGTYKAYVKDNVGNLGECSITVTKIDNTSPVITSASYTSVSGTNYITYAVTDEGSGPYAYYIGATNEVPSENSSSWQTNENTSVTTNTIYDATRAYYIFVKDKVGNISAYFLIGQDTIPPTCMITATPEGIAASKTLTITSTDTDLAASPYSFDGTSYSTTNTKVISKNGVYTGYVKDKADNVGTCSITVTGLDNEAPTITPTIGGGIGTATINAKITDNTKVAAYQITQSTDTPAEWVTVTPTPETNIPFTKTSAGVYYIHAKDENDNVGYAKVELTLSRNESCTCETYKSCSNSACGAACCNYPETTTTTSTYDATCRKYTCTSWGSWGTKEECSSCPPNTSKKQCNYTHDATAQGESVGWCRYRNCASGYYSDCYCPKGGTLNSYTCTVEKETTNTVYGCKASECGYSTCRTSACGCETRQACYLS